MSWNLGLLKNVDAGRDSVSGRQGVAVSCLTFAGRGVSIFELEELDPVQFG